MTNEQIELARQLVAHPRWRWMAGMRRVNCTAVNAGWDFDNGQELGAVRLAREDERAAPRYDGDDRWTVVTWCDGNAQVGGGFPDLTDPATIGCLAALVREVWGTHAWLRRWGNPAPDMSGADRSAWEPCDGLGRRLIPGDRILADTEGEAWARALLAWKR